MPTPDRSRQFAERLGFTVGLAILANITFLTVAPYFLPISTQSVRLIDQQQTILQGVLMILVGYLFGTSSGNKAKDQAIEAQAETIRTTTQAANPPATVTLAPGDVATVKADGDPSP